MIVRSHDCALIVLLHVFLLIWTQSGGFVAAGGGFYTGGLLCQGRHIPSSRRRYPDFTLTCTPTNFFPLAFTMSSLGTLPIELILKIFHMATFDGPDYNVPLALSHVSKDCRAIVSSEAHLWTTIELNDKSAVRRILAAGATIYDIFPSLSVYLRNSGKLPLNISVDYARLPRNASVGDSNDYAEPCKHGFTVQHAAVLGMILLDHLDRLEGFTVRTQSWEIYTVIVNQWTFCRFPLVKNWDVEYGTFADLCLLGDYPIMCKRDLQARESILTRNGGNHTAIDELTEIGQRCFPRLKRLRLNGTPHGWFFSATNLVELVLQNIPTQYRATDKLLQVILSNSQHTLQVLELNGSLHANVDNSSQRLSLPAVHTLKVGFAYIEEMSTLLRIAEFPALTDLSLWHLEDCLNEDQRHQCEMVEVFQEMTEKLPLHQLTALHIDAVSFPREDLHSTIAWDAVRNGTVAQAQYPVIMRFISELNALQALTLVRPRPLFLQSMGYSPPSSMLFLPSLKKLRFETSIPKECLHIAKYWRRRIEVLTLLSGGAFAGPGLEKLELLFPHTQDNAALAGWKNDPQPYAMSMGVEFQRERIPFLLDEDDLYMDDSDSDSDSDDAMDED
ncbi:hypothetical protein ARMGADRAFT_597058 [Armillaria gallica]|uniref:F-box domain-containing protein n=1 Tax=Armillaria gallica TaxID=47427 RepID=A0A2H3CP98_ARMGA|nr:hypothetical protein ARMGADRAFT_597058 [Armillaria gallica]